MTQRDSNRGKNGPLPLRWGVILTIAAGIGLGTGALAGLVAGVGMAMAATGLLANILGGDN